MVGAGDSFWLQVELPLCLCFLRGLGAQVLGVQSSVLRTQYTSARGALEIWNLVLSTQYSLVLVLGTWSSVLSAQHSALSTQYSGARVWAPWSPLKNSACVSIPGEPARICPASVLNSAVSRVWGCFSSGVLFGRGLGSHAGRSVRFCACLGLCFRGLVGGFSGFLGLLGVLRRIVSVWGFFRPETPDATTQPFAEAVGLFSNVSHPVTNSFACGVCQLGAFLGDLLESLGHLVTPFAGFLDPVLPCIL